jgi:hypothetical protein
MEGGPTPSVIGSPGPAFIRIYPVPIGGIRLEIRTGFRHPGIAITGILYPMPVRAQFIIKGLIGDFRIIFGWRSYRRRSHLLGIRRGILVYNINGPAGINNHHPKDHYYK